MLNILMLLFRDISSSKEISAAFIIAAENLSNGDMHSAISDQISFKLGMMAEKPELYIFVTSLLILIRIQIHRDPKKRKPVGQLSLLVFR